MTNRPKERFEDQLKLRKKAMMKQCLLIEILRALEYGTPTAGMGIGIDRLTMFMTNSPSIQDVLFSHK